MAQFQSYNKLLVCEKEQISNYKAGHYVLGYIVHCQYPSYRGTYLSCIEELEVYVDDEKIPENQIYFCLKEKQFLLSQLKDLYQEYWFILDKARLLILKEGGLDNNSGHKVQIKMRHRIPYTGYFGSYMSLDSEDTKMLAVGGEVSVL